MTEKTFVCIQCNKKRLMKSWGIIYHDESILCKFCLSKNLHNHCVVGSDKVSLMPQKLTIFGKIAKFFGVLK